MHITVDQVTWGPPGQPDILRDVSLTAETGEVIGVIGPNGAGKSSLLRCVYRRYKPRSGRVLLDGRDLWSMTARESAQRIAVVLQEMPADFQLTVEDIVQMGRIPYHGLWYADAAKDIRLATSALTQLGLGHLASRPFATLSGGEKQRTLVARAFVQQPDLLILDEPTNHLDIRYQLEVLALVRSLGITVLATVHDLNLAAIYCDRLYLMRDACMVASGPPATVLTPEMIRTVFGVTALVDERPVTGQTRVTFTSSPTQWEAQNWHE